MRVKEAIIIVNGEPLSIEYLRQLSQNKFVLVLDGAYQLACEAGLSIDALLGDFDSIEKEQLATAKAKGIAVIYAPDQNDTDLEKGIHYLDKLNCHKITITCATGFRLDQTLHNIRLLSRYYQPDRFLEVFTKKERVFLLRDQQIDYSASPGERFALLGAPEAVVTTQGLRYDMDNYALTFSGNSSVSNQVKKSKVKISVMGSVLVIASNCAFSS